MSTPEYNVWILNTSGTRVALVDDYKRLSYSLRTSRPGRFELELHRDSVHQQYLLKNYQIEIVRNGVSVQGGRIGRRAPNYGPDGKASEYMVASGASWLSMLGWRVIIPPAGSTHMADNDSIDDVMKYFVRQNCLTGTVVDPDRAITGLTVQADAGAHPTTANLRGRYQNLLDQLIAWSDTYGVDFDLVRTATGWDFRTYYPRLGTDRTEGNGAVVPVIFSINRGNVSEFEWWEDALEVQNFLYVGGQGEGTEREIVTRQDTNSIADWDRRENFVDARDLQYTSDLNLRGDEKLAAHGTEARGLKFRAIPVDNAVWGTDWFLGDKVTVYDPEWSITESAKIVEIDVEVTREDGETVVPIIGDLMPTLLDRIGEGQVDDGNQAGGDTPADPTAPDAPTGLSYSSAVQQDSKTGDFTAVLELAWSANTETDLDYYQVEVKLSTATNWDSAVTRATNFDWLGLIPGGSYVARVYAVDRAGNRSTAADFNGGGAITVTSDTTAPAAPANVIATGAFSKVIIEWDENSELDLAGYEVYVSDSSGFTPGAANLAYRGRSTAIAYTGVVSNTYYVRVRAYDRSGNASPYCNQASASTAQIGTTDISDLAVTNAKIGSLAVDAAKIANATITGGKIANEQVDTQHLVTNLIHTKKITIGTDGQASVVIDGATATKALYGYSWTGAAQQLEVAIYASGTNAGKIVAGAGNIVLDGTALTFVPTAGSNTYLRFKAAGAAHEIGNIYADTSSDLIGLAKANATSGSLETMVYLRASTIELVNNAALGGSIAQVLLDASGHTQLWGYLYPGASGKQTTRYLYDAGATSGLAVAGGYFSTTSRLYIGTGSAVQTYHYFVADSDGFLNYTGRFLVGSSWPAGSVGLAVDPRTWAATDVVVNQFAIGAKSIAITEGVVGQTGNLYTAAIGVVTYSQSVKITTVPVAASLYIAGAPASSGTLSITAGYAIYVAAGNVCIGSTHYISGNATGIGIDVATPLRGFHFHGDDFLLSNTRTALGAFTAIEFYNESSASGDAAKIHAQIRPVLEEASSPYNKVGLAFLTSNNDRGGGVDRMRISWDGNVGMGASPSSTARLLVSGPTSVAGSAAGPILQLMTASVTTNFSGATAQTGNVYQISINEGAFTATTAGSVIPIAATVLIGGAPTASGNASITDSRALWIAGGSAVFGAPTGGGQGTGTINAKAVYDDGSGPLTDWVFDLHYDGVVSEKNKRFWQGQPLYSLDEVRATTRAERHLPWMPTAKNIEKERSLGKMVTRLWQGQEQQQIYIMELEARIADLEEKILKSRLN